MSETYKKLPRYFIVEGVPVKVVQEGDEVACYTWNGIPFGLGKALTGREVTAFEFIRTRNALVSQ